MTEKTERPSIVLDKHLEYLDALRESGVTNMFGAAPYVRRAFRMEEGDAWRVLLYWMKSFNERKAERNENNSEQETRT